MKKIFISIFVLLFLFIGLSFIDSTKAQSPPKCGYLNEPCCNFAGSSNSCKTGVGLTCKSGQCVSDGTNPSPPIRPGTNTNNTTSGNSDLTCEVNGSTGVQTAIGCIPFSDQTNFSATILRWAVGVGSGIAFALMLYAGFMTMTASGNPERIKAGQELMTSAIAGLILLVFSVFILKFIGIDILGLNAFGFGK